MKQHTIIFVPHARAKFRKWRLTTLQASLALGLIVTLTLTGIVATVLYFDTAFDRQKLAEIERENQSLQEVNSSFETSIQDLNTQLAEFQERIRKLAIVAEISELSAGEDAGIGGPSIEETPDQIGALERQFGDMSSDVARIEDRFLQRRVKISSTPAVSPVKGLLTSRFGYRTDPFTKNRAFHNGIDIVAPKGKEVRSTGDGVVVKAERMQGLGNAIYVAHGYGITTRYGHLSGFNVEAGQTVRRGDVIGYVGNTGRSSGTHLHYEVREDGRPADPLAFILDSTAP